MKAFVVEHYGKDGLHAADVPKPQPGPRDVLVKVSAASINPLDKLVRDGEFKQLLKYKPPFVLGHDVAGTVTSVGSAVRGFNVGDEIYARPGDLRIGTFAEYIAIDEDDVALKPATLTMAEAAAVPLVALAAWQILVERAASGQGRRYWSMAAPAAWDPLSSSSPSTSVHTSPPLHAVLSRTWCAPSGPTWSSTTPSRTFPRCCPATTSSSTVSAETT